MIWLWGEKIDTLYQMISFNSRHEFSCYFLVFGESFESSAYTGIRISAVLYQPMNLTKPSP